MGNPSINITREQLLRLLDGHRVQLQTSVGLLEAHGVPDEAWQPLTQQRVPFNIVHNHQKHGFPVPVELWANDTYEVFVTLLTPDDEGMHPDLRELVEEHMTGKAGAVHLSIKRYDRAAIRNWRHFQQMKNEICGTEREGMEIFPAESRLADNANQYHMWVLPEGVAIPLGFESGMVLIRDDEVALYNSASHSGRQEPRQDGLTVGDALDGARTPDQDEHVRRLLS